MIPAAAPVSGETIDPSDIADFVIDLSPMLEEGEQFAAITFTLPPETDALGFRVLTEAPYAPFEIDDSHLRIWVTVDEASRNSEAWNSSGTVCAIEFSAITDSVPAREWQRTIAIRVAQR